MEERDLLSDLQDISDSERKTSSAESSSGELSVCTWRGLGAAAGHLGSLLRFLPSGVRVSF